MGQATSKVQVIEQLRAKIMALQGDARLLKKVETIGLEAIEKAFPHGRFALGAVHEFVSPGPMETAATSAFMAVLIGRLMPNNAYCIWISHRRSLFPPALSSFGIAPERIIFVDLASEHEVIWAMEEALKCKDLFGVVAEVRELSFMHSRRLQLAVEKSQVTGFVHRCHPRTENPTACVTRWKVEHLPSVVYDGLPGLGFPRWKVQLMKVRNGKPGAWEVAWASGQLLIKNPEEWSADVSFPQRKSA